MTPGRWWLPWLQFLGFFVLAFFIWIAIETDRSTIVQRALEVPLSVTGLRENQLAPGVPESVIVILSGVSETVERVRPEMFDAFIDLRGIEREFNVPVRTTDLGGIDIIEVIPGSVIGIIEALETRSAPVRVFLPSSLDSDGLRVGANVQDALVSGQETRLDRVAYVTALLDPLPEEDGALTRPLFAVDANHQPIRDLSITPAEVTVTLVHEPVLYRRSLPIELALPDPDPLEIVDTELSALELAVAGPHEAVQALEVVPLSVTLPDAPGSYLLTAEPLLPEGVTALDEVTVQISLAGPAPVEAPASTFPLLP